MVVCVCVYTMRLCTPVCERKVLGGSWPRLFFSAPALGSPLSSCDWCAPVADRAEARAQGPAEADVYLWSETASVRGSWSSNILILTSTALGLIFSSRRTHQVLFLLLIVGHWAKSLLIVVLVVVYYHYAKHENFSTVFMSFIFW